MGYVAEDLIERGILTGSEVTALKDARAKEREGNKERGVAVDNNGEKTRIVKEIKVDTKECVGCRACEIACSAFHAIPKYSSINTARSRIMVVMDETRDIFVPIRAGQYTEAECNGRNRYMIDGKEYDECTFCPASCPSRGAFRDPDSRSPAQVRYV